MLAESQVAFLAVLQVGDLFYIFLPLRAKIDVQAWVIWLSHDLVDLCHNVCVCVDVAFDVHEALQLHVAEALAYHRFIFVNKKLVAPLEKAVHYIQHPSVEYGCIFQLF